MSRQGTRFPGQEPLEVLLALQGELWRTVLGFEVLQQRDRSQAFLVRLKGHSEWVKKVLANSMVRVLPKSQPVVGYLAKPSSP